MSTLDATARPSSSTKLLWSLKETALYLGVSVDVAAKFVEAGHIRRLDMPGVRRCVVAASVESFAASLKQG